MPWNLGEKDYIDLCIRKYLTSNLKKSSSTTIYI